MKRSIWRLASDLETFLHVATPWFGLAVSDKGYDPVRDGWWTGVVLCWGRTKFPKGFENPWKHTRELRMAGGLFHR